MTGIGRRRFSGGVGHRLIALGVAAAAAAVAGRSGGFASWSAAGQDTSWIDRRVAALPPADASPGGAAARFELAEEIAALRGGLFPLSSAPDLRIAMLDLLAEAVELDESWTEPALRLAAHAESDRQRRSRFERMLDSVIGDPSSTRAPPQDRLEESRILALYRSGRVEEAAERLRRDELDRLLSSPWLERALDGGGDRIRRDLATGTAPLLKPEERRRLVEFDRARLSPDSLRFSDSAWLDGWAPLPEVDADALAAWLRSMAR